MVWSNNDAWMITGDHSGYSKYWQSNMNNVKMFQAHKEAIRGLRYLSIYFLILYVVTESVKNFLNKQTMLLNHIHLITLATAVIFLKISIPCTYI